MSIVEYYEQYIHAGVYYSLLAVMPLLEMLFPLRTNKHPLMLRWASNFLLGVINSIVQRLAIPVVALAFAAYVHQQGWGLFNILHIPIIVAVILSILILDFNKYILHWLYHFVPLFWTFHKIHHSDPDYDFTTSFRFHPLEHLLGIANTLVIVLLFGMPVISIIILELLYISINYIVHTNIKLPVMLEKIMRSVFVTPNMHRIHHSAYKPHTNSNYGIIFPYWDYLFKTYTPVDAVDQENMTIGLMDCRNRKHINIFWLLAMPFVPEKPERTKS